MIYETPKTTTRKSNSFISETTSSVEERREVKARSTITFFISFNFVEANSHKKNETKIQKNPSAFNSRAAKRTVDSYSSIGVVDWSDKKRRTKKSVSAVTRRKERRKLKQHSIIINSSLVEVMAIIKSQTDTQTNSFHMRKEE